MSVLRVNPSCANLNKSGHTKYEIAIGRHSCFEQRIWGWDWDRGLGFKRAYDNTRHRLDTADKK